MHHSGPFEKAIATFGSNLCRPLYTREIELISDTAKTRKRWCFQAVEDNPDGANLPVGHTENNDAVLVVVEEKNWQDRRQGGSIPNYIQKSNARFEAFTGFCRSAQTI